MKSFSLAIPVSPKRTCLITVGDGALDELAGTVAALDPDTVLLLHDVRLTEIAQRVQEFLPAAKSFAIPCGETSKSLEQVEKIMEQLILRHASTQSVLVSVGGGTLTDLGGFAASVFARGIRCVHVPTNLMGMADAAIGGKTYINIGKVKNMAGTCWHPEAVFADTSLLQNLPRRQVEEGLVEILKIAALTDAEFFGWLEEHIDSCLTKDARILEVCVQNAVQAKIAVLESGFKNGQSNFLLNFGHTVGHAIEALSHFALSHAEAISIGMLLEMSVAKSEARERIESLLTQLSMPIDLPPRIHPRDLWEVILSDKNVRSSGDVRIAVPKAIGTHAILPMTKEQLLEACS